VEQKQKLTRLAGIYQQEVGFLKTNLMRQKMVELQQAQRSLMSIDRQLNAIERRQPTPQDKLKKAGAERNMQMWQENYLSLTKQLYQQRVLEQASRRQGAITILERPQIGSEAVSPGKKEPMSPILRFVLGVPFCFLFGAGTALATDYLFASLRLQPRIEEALNIPVIALIPPVPRDIMERWDRMKKGESLPDSATPVVGL
jgi:hypothetical protein